jgi:hypothetical protein
VYKKTLNPFSPDRKFNSGYTWPMDLYNVLHKEKLYNLLDYFFLTHGEDGGCSTIPDIFSESIKDKR